MTAGPGDEAAAAEGRGQGELRASHADREQVIELLKAAFVQDRLTKDELDTRVGQAFASRTQAELAAVTADLPAGLIAAPTPPPALVQAPPAVVTDIKTTARMIVTATAIPAGLWALAVFVPTSDADDDGVLRLALSATLIWLVFLLLVGVDLLYARREKR